MSNLAGWFAALQLAQFAEVPPSLPSPPFYEKYLLEAPAVPVVLLAAGAIAAFFILNRQGKAARGLLVAGLLAALAGGVALLASAVRTDREAMADATRELVSAVSRSDTAALERLLDPDARLLTPLSIGIPSLGLAKPEIIRRAAETMRQYPLSAADVVTSQAEVTGKDLGRTQVRVRVVPTAYNLPHTSWWVLEWRRTPTGQWRALIVRPVSIDGVSG